MIYNESLSVLNTTVKVSLSSVHAHVAQQQSRNKSVYEDIERRKSLIENHCSLYKFSAIFVARHERGHLCCAIFVAQHERE